ncbi:MAG: replicative DNA helicase [Candidatus Eisenbacteria bacterium]|uniref:Replicative DNA helicase n=1 Tax=Eiseniibacteriota bacterium TaxID=2212470 RepID=A0A956RQX0_UNCEI|nr:replicative DNA helicase [Candidatus Eisenbacteria bacterium]
MAGFETGGAVRTLNPGSGRLPPQAIEAEQSVLGAMLLEKEAIGRAAEILTPESFYRDAHRKVFEAIVALYEKGESADLITVTEELRRRGQLEAVGGAAFLSSMLDLVPTAANVAFHAELVLEKAVLRKLIEVATSIVQKGYDATDRSGEIIDQAEEMIFGIADPRLRKGFTSLKELLPPAVRMIEEVVERKRAVTGVPSGFLDLDKMTAGFQKSDLIIVAGRPSMGKTAFALNLAEFAAAHENVPVGVFSLEMSQEQLVMRLLSSQARIPSHRLRTGYLRPEEWEGLAQAAGVLSEAPVFIDDTPAITATEMRAKARRLKKEHDIGLIVVDYLQLMRAGTKVESREKEVSEISRSLKALAKEISVPVIALSQLSRAVEQRDDKRPMLSDLRESGAIEQDADLVLFVFREEFYKPEKQEVKGMAEIIVGKHRNGPTGRVHLTFVGELARFESYSERSFESDDDPF